MPAICYSFDSEGAFTQQDYAQKNQRGKGYLLPANSTLVRPPIPPLYSWVKWTGEKWEIVPDFRGIYYNKRTRERVLIKLGEIPTGMLTRHIPMDGQVWRRGAWRYTIWARVRLFFLFLIRPWTKEVT